LDDEVMVLRALARVLRDEYDVIAVSSPEEALQRLAMREPFDVVLSDLMMPAMSGIDFARRAALECPAVAGRILLMTGGALPPATLDALEKWRLPMISKPMDKDRLLAALTAVGSKGASSSDASAVEMNHRP
jgi:CheY-like chemotaxis protein